MLCSDGSVGYEGCGIGLTAIVPYLRAVPNSIMFGALLIVVSTALYYMAQGYMTYLTAERVKLFETLAYSYFTILFAGIGLAFYGGLGRLRAGRQQVRALEIIPINWHWLIPYVLSVRKYGRLFPLASLAYGLFYSFVTSMVVYQPTVTFSEVYLAEIPSVRVVPAFGPPGQIPILIVYLTEHLGLLLVPLSIILLVAVSVLVGLNITLASFAYSNRPTGRGDHWLCGFGAIVALFTGCPTCAGLFLASMAGGLGATAAASLLASYQSLFIGISIPILVVTPLVIVRSLSKTFKSGCILNEARMRVRP